MNRSAVAALLVAVACTGSGDPAAAPTESVATTAPAESTVTETLPTSTTPTSATTAGSTSVEESPLVCWTAPVEAATGPLVFEDSTTEYGLEAPLTGMYGHAAAFGDVNADGWADLLVGTFADRPDEDYAFRGADGPSPDLLLTAPAPYTVSEGFSAEMGRTSGAVFADFDGDLDSDLLLIRNDDEDPPPSALFENEDGTLTEVGNPLPDRFNGRTPAVADFDGDGLLDVYVSEDRYGETGGVLLHNQSGLAFADVTDGSGLEDVFALGTTAADLDRDGDADLVTSDRVFLGNGDLTFSDATPDEFGWDQIGPDDDPAGVAIGDIDNDGAPDIVVGHHFRSIIEEGAEVPVRMFRNLGGGEFEEVTEAVGLVDLPTLAPHVELADLDNDGWLDLVTSGSAGDGSLPAVFRNRGGTFEAPTGLGSVQYWVGAPVADVDHDGRLDIFALEWEPSLPSILFRNTGSSGHWLEVSAPVGTVVEVDRADGLISRQEIGVSRGYSSAGLPVAHFGLGDAESVTVTISPPGAEPVMLDSIPADTHIRWPDGC